MPTTTCGNSGRGASARFSGTAAYEVESTTREASPGKQIYSQVYNLSELSQKPACISLRYMSLGANGSTVNCQAVVSVWVPVYATGTDGQQTIAWQRLSTAGNFGIGGETWGGDWYELPDDIAWDRFQLKLGCGNAFVTDIGGETSYSFAPGGILIDSIGIGYDTARIPYTYMEGTSMAAPTTTGVGAVLANSAGAKDSAAELAARIKGSTVYDARYEGKSTTEGYVTVFGGSDPGPVPVSATVSDDGSRTMSVGAYFADAGTTVTVNGAQASGVTVTDDEAAGDGRVTLTFKAPDSWTGGYTVIGLTGSPDSAVKGHERILSVTLGNDANQAYYDEQNLPLPEGIDGWDAVDLVAYAGKVYALPRSDELSHSKLADAVTSIPVYDPATRAWSDLALPSDKLVLADGTADKVSDLSAVPIDGKLFFRAYDDGNAQPAPTEGTARDWYFAYDAGTGAWEVYGYDDAFGDVPALATLGYDGTNAYLFGGSQVNLEQPGKPKDSNAVFKLDLDKICSNPGARTEITGFAAQAGTMQKVRLHPCVAYGNGAFLVGNGYQQSTTQLGNAPGIERVTIGSNGTATAAMVDTSSQIEDTGQLSFGVAAVADGFMAVGPKNRAADADTYLVSGEGALTGTYAKRASADNLLVPAAVATGGRLYAIAGTQPLDASGEGAGPAWTFSSTAVDTAVQPGDFRQTVRFDANGGEGAMDEMQVTYGDTAALAKNAFTRAGYAFTGWNTAADGSGTAYADGASFTASQTAPATLYAQWAAVTASDESGATAAGASVGAEAGEAAKGAARAIAGSDLSAAGIEEALAGYGMSDGDAAAIAGKVSDALTGLPAGSRAEVAATLNITAAKDDAMAVSVKDELAALAGDGAGLTYLDVSATLQVRIDIISADGKTASVDCGTAEVHQLPSEIAVTLDLDGYGLSAADRVLALLAKHGTDAAARVDAALDRGAGTLAFETSRFSPYAVASYDSCTVTFDPAGGTISGGEAAQSVPFGSRIAYPTATREGYAFDGWYAGDTAFAADTLEADAVEGTSLTLTAHWKAADGAAATSSTAPRSATPTTGDALGIAAAAAAIAALAAAGVALAARRRRHMK